MFIIFLLAHFPSHSQNYIYQENFDTDSLIRVVKEQQGEEWVITMNNLSMAFMYHDHDKGKLYADSALEMAQKLNYEKGIASASRFLGWHSFLQSHYVQALIYFFDALQFYEMSNDRLILARLYYEIAFVHFIALNHEKSVEYYESALSVYREQTINNKTVGGLRDTIDVMTMLAENYVMMDIEHQKQLEYMLMGLRAKERINYGTEELILRNFLVGVRYILINIDSSMAYFRRSLRCPDDNLSVMALKRRSIGVIANLHYYQGHLDSALYLLEQNYHWYDDHGILLWAHDALTSLGTIQFANNNINAGEHYLLKADEIFKEMQIRDSWFRHDSLEDLVTYGYELYFPLPGDERKKMMWTEGKVLYQYLYEINVGKGNINEALKYHIAYTAAKDTLNRIQAGRETIELQLKLETEQKERQIDLLGQENKFKAYKLRQTSYLLFGLGGLVLLTILLAVIMIRNNKLRESQKNLILQQKLLRSQMNPHFLFNTLVSIQNFILQQKSDLAGKYLSKFSMLVRTILDSSFKDHILLADEINTLKNYMDLQKIRYPGKFEYGVEIDQSLDTESIHLPPILLQPFVENAIEHGLKHKEGKGQISLRFLKREDQFICEIEDDGVGREKAMEAERSNGKTHQSLATNIVKERIQNLNKNLKRKIHFNIIDLKSEANAPLGTMVVISFPL